jgi:hypothetical protein
MRSLTDRETRLSANSLPEITEALTHLAQQYGRDYRFGGRRIKMGPLLNAITLHFLLLDDGERRAIVERAVPALEALLEVAPDINGFIARVEHRAGSPAWAPASPPAARAEAKRSG